MLVSVATWPATPAPAPTATRGRRAITIVLVAMVVIVLAWVAVFARLGPFSTSKIGIGGLTFASELVVSGVAPAPPTATAPATTAATITLGLAIGLCRRRRRNLGRLAARWARFRGRANRTPRGAPGTNGCRSGGGGRLEQDRRNHWRDRWGCRACGRAAGLTGRRGICSGSCRPAPGGALRGRAGGFGGLRGRGVVVCRRHRSVRSSSGGSDRCVGPSRRFLRGPLTRRGWRDGCLITSRRGCFGTGAARDVFRRAGGSLLGRAATSSCGCRGCGVFGVRGIGGRLIFEHENVIFRRALGRRVLLVERPASNLAAPHESKSCGRSSRPGDHSGNRVAHRARCKFCKGKLW